MRNIVSLAAISLLGCAATAPLPAPDNKVSSGFSPPVRGSLVVFAPPPESKDLTKGYGQLTRQLDIQLKAAGYRVATLTRSNYDTLWAQHSAAVGGVFDPSTGAQRAEAYARAMSTLARTVCEEVGCELLLVPSFARRSAALEGTQAEWDGVRQSMRFKEGAPLSSYRATGTTAAISVNLLALTKTGELAFRTYGGATLPFLTNIRETKAELRIDPFSDEQDLANAVRIALQPLGK